MGNKDQNKTKKHISVYAKDKSGSNDCSEILVKELKKKSGNKGIKLPQYISFILENDSTILLYIQEQKTDDGSTLNALTENMQGDNAAFEGWAIVLKAWCPDKASKIRLKWDVPLLKTSNEKSHYNRFCPYSRCTRKSIRYSKRNKT